MKRVSLMCAVGLTALGSVVACSTEAAPVSEKPETVGSTAGPTFEQWVSTLGRVPDGPYLVERDIALYTDTQLHEYFDTYVDPHASALVIDGMVSGATQIDDRWTRADALNLTYCVSGNFGSDLATVRSAMAAAAARWSDATFVNYVDLTDRSDLGACRADNYNFTFNVEPNTVMSWDAYAFTPKVPRNQRVISLNLPSIARYTGTPRQTLTGILRV